MNARAALLVRAFKVGDFECTLTFPSMVDGTALSMVAEWSPSMPTLLTRVEMDQYRAGRNAALEELAARTGVNVAVIE